MAWNGNSESNQTVYKNYMYGENVFILDEITTTNCAFLIGDLTAFLSEKENHGKLLNVFINSPGGDVNTMMTLLGLFNLARLNDITIKTYVLGCASSAASILAVQGDYRFMTAVSKHFIHFGQICDVTTKHSEIDKIHNQNKEYAEQMQNLYIQSCKGKLSKEMLLTLQDDERGYLNAKQCVKYGLCDTIIEDELQEKRDAEEKGHQLEKEFTQYMQDKKKKEKSVHKLTKKKGK